LLWDRVRVRVRVRRRRGLLSSSPSSSAACCVSGARLLPDLLWPRRSMTGPATFSNVDMASVSICRVSGDAMMACAASIASCRPLRPWRTPMK